MNVPTDRLLIMIVVATGFAVLFGGWAASLVQAEATGTEEILLRVGIGVVFFAALFVAWHQFAEIDEESS